jgi:hypothetical protein
LLGRRPVFCKGKTISPEGGIVIAAFGAGLDVGRHWLLFSSKFPCIVASGLSNAGLKGSLRHQRII